jgi:hypothetical protein
MGGIKLSAQFKPQADENNIVSLFNKSSTKSPTKKQPSGSQSEEEESSEDDDQELQYELSKIKTGTAPSMNIMVESDKRRF